jgi:TonB-dependent SusC/RagA subfamily outer membrane receptor
MRSRLLTRTVSRLPAARVSGALVRALALAALAGCHAGAYNAARPTPTDSVNVGYGKQSKEQTGRSVVSATAEQMAAIKTTRVEELLESRFPGVHVFRLAGGGLSVRIRGPGSLLGNGEPLYVIDGVPMTADPVLGLSWLNPADIARIDVLKNPPETSLYGVRGANGVIIITTKLRR